MLESEYEGCYKESVPQGRSLPEDLGDSPEMTAFLCRERALERKFKYYATQNGSRCFAGNADPRFLGAAEGGCRAGCSGNPAFQCGGPSENMLYRLPVYDRELDGCVDASAATPLKTKVTIPNMTFELCRTWAVKQGFNYYGMQAPGTCMGEFISQQGRLSPASDCDEPCAGDASQACGGKPDRSASIFRMITTDPTGAGCLCSFVQDGCTAVHAGWSGACMHACVLCSIAAARPGTSFTR